MECPSFRLGVEPCYMCKTCCYAYNPGLLSLGGESACSLFMAGPPSSSLYDVATRGELPKGATPSGAAARGRC